MVYGYARISTGKQKIDRQIANIKEEYPDALIMTEEYTGTKINRPVFAKLLKKVQSGDLIVFDEVSRMSRNGSEGFKLYQELFNKGVELAFIKEPHINTRVYREKLDHHLQTIKTGNIPTDNLLDAVTKAVKAFMCDLAREQIELAFESAQKEVDYLHKRTSEGVRRAQVQGKQVGRVAGKKVETKKGKQAKQIIKKHSKDFGGSLSDKEVWTLAGISRNSYYKYKAELKK